MGEQAGTVTDAAVDGGARYDLHTHSTFSDGSQTPEQIVAEACGLGLARIAITDHDSLRQLSRVRRVARDAAIPVLAGTEVSCMDHRTGRKIHILAFGLEATRDSSGPLERIVDETLAARTANTLWQAWRIIRARVEFDRWGLSMEELLRASRESTGVYKQHVMWALTELDYNDARYQACYRRLFKNGGIAQRDIDYPEATEAVRAVREQGGVPVLAHPQQMNSWESVPDLLRAGLMGIEAYHPDNDEAATARVFELVREHGLIATGGSDYHGRNGAPALGQCTIAAEEAGEGVERLFERERTLG
jgi:phosphoribosyl 1,2-cyclic phosphate 1,2-diphosphodiesterase